MKEWALATCATTGLVIISLSIRLCRHKSMAVARGVVLVKPDAPFLVKVCNFCPDQAIVRKNSILGVAEPFQGPMLAAITEEKETQETPNGEDPSTSDDPIEDVDLSEAPGHLHKQIREMLRTHSAMWDGTLGTLHPTEHAIVTPTDAVPIRGCRTTVLLLKSDIFDWTRRQHEFGYANFCGLRIRICIKHSGLLPRRYFYFLTSYSGLNMEMYFDTLTQ